MYKDLSLKEKAKVLQYGGKLGLTSVEDIAKLYDDAIREPLKYSDTNSNIPTREQYLAQRATKEQQKSHKYQLGNWIAKQYYNARIQPKIDELGIDEVRQRLYDNIYPQYYEDVSRRVRRALENIPDNYMKSDELKYMPERDDIWAEYLQIPREKRHKDKDIFNKRYTISKSNYSPSKGNNDNSTYYKINKLPSFLKQDLIEDVFGSDRFLGRHGSPLKFGESIVASPLDKFFGAHTISRGVDKQKGEYVSYYDLWDLAPLTDKGDESQGLGKPLEFYDRVYLDDYYGIDSTPELGTYYGGYLKPVTITPNEYKKGGPIVSPYGQWKYPGRDTIIPSNNITMDNVNYPVLGISDAGDTKIMMPWNDYKFKGSMVYEHPLIDNQFQLGGNTKPTFNQWYPTVPKQKNDTSSYDLRRAYNTLPFDEMQKFRTINDYHLPSVAYDEKTDTYTFLKRNGHPTLNYELDWYNSGSPDAQEFRERYRLDTLSQPWRYIPRTYQKGGNAQNYQNIPEYNIALYNTVSPLGDFPNFWGALAYRRQVKDKLKNGNIYERDYKVGNTQGEKTAMAAWAKRLGIPYDEQDLPVYNGDTVTLPYSLVQEIPYDTNMLKNRIQQNKALQDKYSKYRYSDVVDAAIKADQYNLDKLRETYKTGKPVGQTEFGWNSRQLVDNGEIVPIENIQSPLNVLGNYNVRYSPKERRLYYSDEYDFNQFENFVPGEPYRIRGYIDLDNNKSLGGNLFKKGGIYIKPENRGKFTALKKRTGHSASWFKAHGTPAQKKMATFALNSRHWNHKHDEGGYLYSEGGFLLAPYLYNE